MPLSADQIEYLREIESDIARLESVQAVTSGLGASHSRQGITSNFTQKQIDEANYKLPILRRIRRSLLAIQAGNAASPAPGVNLSYYRPDTSRVSL